MADDNQAKVVWLSGLSGAGKTTLGRLLHQTLRERGLKVDFLDGDIVRKFFEDDLGYTRPERIQNVRRVTFAAKKLADNGIFVIVANIAPYYEVRDFIRRKLAGQYLQIYVKASLQEVQSRDVKGLYSSPATEGIGQLVGRDDPYETPRNPDLVLDTSAESVEQSFERICALLKERGVL